MTWDFNDIKPIGKTYKALVHIIFSSCNYGSLET